MSSLRRRRLVAASVVAVLLGGQTVFAVLAEPRLRPPPPTPVNGRPSSFPSALDTPSDAMARPQIPARAAVLVDLGTGSVLYRKASRTPQPVASLTKVMTALLTLERSDLDDVVRVDPAAVFSDDDYGATSTLGLRVGERITVENLLYALLLGSANDAADALAIHVSGDRSRFVVAMNRRAARLGMTDTRFFSTNGLDDRGRSTARDLLFLMRAADAEPEFRQIVATRFHEIPAPKGRDRRIQNRNALLWLYRGAVGTKTGVTAAAGFCLIAMAERGERRLIAIVLGSPDEPFSSAAALLDHGFEGFTQRTVVRAGDDLGALRIRGGTVPVVAGASLEALVPTAALDDLETVTTISPDAAFPPALGEIVATYTVRAPGLRIGSVPLVVASVPSPPALDGPWWVRTAVTIGRAVDTAVGSFAD